MLSFGVFFLARLRQLINKQKKLMFLKNQLNWRSSRQKNRKKLIFRNKLVIILSITPLPKQLALQLRGEAKHHIYLDWCLPIPMNLPIIPVALHIFVFLNTCIVVCTKLCIRKITSLFLSKVGERLNNLTSDGRINHICGDFIQVEW